MTTPMTKKLLVTITAFCTSIPVSLIAATPLDLSDAPLAVSTTVEPNVMLLIDNSGSMDNMVWDIERNIPDGSGGLVLRSSLPAPAAAPYDSTVTYPHWGSNDWPATTGNMLLGNINTGACGADFREGIDPLDATNIKCIQLPAPRGNSTRYTGNYLNYIFSSYPPNFDLTSYTWFPQETRMTTVRDSTTLLVNNIPNIRFGVASFNTSAGGRINAACGSNTTDLTNAIAGLNASTWTPLAEAYYEVTRYFRGLRGHFNNVQYTSPVQYRCQQNFAVVLTDGLPTQDSAIPSNANSDPDVQSGCSSANIDSDPPCLPNWDELAPATLQATSPNFPQYSDGFDSATNSTAEGHALFLDDIAKFAYEIDLRTDPAKPGANAADTGEDLADISFDDLSFNGIYEKQNLKTFTIGFAINNQMLEDAAYYGQNPQLDATGNIKTDVNGNLIKNEGYFTANDTSELATAFAKIIQGVQQTTGSAAAVAASTGFLTEDTLLFQALYDSNNWEGRLRAFELDPVTRQLVKDAQGDPQVLWDAGDKLTAQAYTSRFIVTYGKKAGAAVGAASEGFLFDWGNFPAEYIAALTYVDPALPADTADDQYIFEYTLGDRSREELTANAQAQAGGIFRSRGKLVQVDVPDPNNPGLTKKQIIEFTSNILGDIVNSSPAYVGQPVLPYPDKWNETISINNNTSSPTIITQTAPENATAVETYSEFRLKYSGKDQNSGYDRSDYAMIYVGSNGGMLHGFKATSPNDKTDAQGNVTKAGDPDAGTELFAYIPSPVIPNLKDLADPNYAHKFFVDGAPTVLDAFYTSVTESTPRWHTTLAAGLNNGGQGIYVLDVTDPKDAFSKTETAAKNLVQWEFTDSDDNDLGNTFAKPAIVRMANGRWAVIFGNGYNNTIDDDSDGSTTNDSTTGNSVIYIAFIEGPGTDGTWDLGSDYIKIDTGVGLDDDISNPTHANYHGGGTACNRNGTAAGGSGAFDITQSKPNGMATVAPVDTNGDFIIDFLYAGDLYGNLWKIDVRSNNTANWESFLSTGNGANANPGPLFRARTGACPQPITTPPAVIRADGGSMVLFGTGKFIETTDTEVNATTRTQTFYGLLDQTEYANNPATHPAKTDSLWTEQTILEADEVNGTARTFTNADTGDDHVEETRETSSNGANDGTFYDWFMDLPASGERVVFEPFTRGFFNPKIIFVTTIPNEDVCTAGGISWLMELDARDGTKTEKPVFDLNFDGNLNGADNANSTVLNGWKTPGIATAPTVIAAGGVDIKAMSTSTGSLELRQEAPPEGSFGRQSWRQIK